MEINALVTPLETPSPAGDTGTRFFRGIAFALSFSNFSNAFTHRSLPGYFNPTALTQNSKYTSEPNWIASIKRS
jgi:hypothetical protein